MQLSATRAFSVLHLVLIGLSVLLLSAMGHNFAKLRAVTLGAIALAGTLAWWLFPWY